MLWDNNYYIGSEVNIFLSTQNIKYAQNAIDQLYALSQSGALTKEATEGGAALNVPFRGLEWLMSFSLLKDLPEFTSGNPKAIDGYPDKIAALRSWFVDVAANALKSESFMDSQGENFHSGQNIPARFCAFYIAAGVLNNDTALFNRGISYVKSLIDQAATDGSLPQEEERGARAVIYENAATQAAVLGAAWARTQGVDLFGYTNKNGQSLRDIVGFTLDVFDTAALLHPFTNETLDSPENPYWMGIYNYYYPTPWISDYRGQADETDHYIGSAVLPYGDFSREGPPLATGGQFDTVPAGGYSISKAQTIASATTAPFVEIGATTTDKGHLTVEGPAASLQADQYIAIGRGGNGQLDIGSGGKVASWDAFVGYSAGSVGTVSVDGAGSAWTIAHLLKVGGQGQGEVSISNGGSVSSMDTVLGAGSTGVGHVVVSGENSQLSSSRSLTIGQFGEGELTLSNGGDASVVGTAWGVRIAPFPGARGVLNIGSDPTANASAPGVLNATFVQLGAATPAAKTLSNGEGDATINFNHTSNDYLFSPDIIGTGTVNILGGTTTLAGENTFAGQLNVRNARLNVTDANQIDGITANIALSSGYLSFAEGIGSQIDAPIALTGDSSMEIGEGSNVALSGTITGAGRLNKLGAGELFVDGDAGGFTGTTSVSDGGLIVGPAGVLGGNAVVQTGAVLGGYGAIRGDVDVQSGGTMSPGNSIGTLSIDGDLTMETGSRYAMEIAGSGAGDLARVGGVANVDGGDVVVTALDPRTSYQDGQTYTILTAQGGVNGAFDGTTTQSAFLDLNLLYDQSDVKLKIGLKAPVAKPVAPVVFETTAVSNNQIATARALDTLGQSGTSLALYNKLLVLDADSSRSAYDALSGEIHASAKGALFDESHFVRDAVSDRIHAISGESGQMTSADTDPSAVWLKTYDAWGSADGSGNSAKLERSTNGFVVGVDAPLGDAWHAGALAGFGSSSLNADGHSSSALVDSYTLGAYAAAEVKDVGLLFGLANTWHDITVSRNIEFPGFADRAASSYDARSLQVFGEASYAIHAGPADFEPFAGIAYVNVGTDGYDENGIAGLHGDSDTTGVTYTTLGLRASTEVSLGGMRGSLRGMLGWQHAFGDTDTLARQAFNGSTAFAVSGAPIDKDTALVEAGFDLDVSSAAKLGVSYQGQIGGDVQRHDFNATLAVSF